MNGVLPAKPTRQRERRNLGRQARFAFASLAAFVIRAARARIAMDDIALAAALGQAATPARLACLAALSEAGAEAALAAAFAAAVAWRAWLVYYDRLFPGDPELHPLSEKHSDKRSGEWGCEADDYVEHAGPRLCCCSKYIIAHAEKTQAHHRQGRQEAF